MIVEMIRLLVFILTICFHIVTPFLLDNIKTVHLYVSPTGSDNNNGQDISHPIKTIQKAVSHLSDHDIHNQNVVINLRHGYYDLPSTLYIVNTPSRKVTFQAYNDEEVHITGGKRLPNTGFHVVKDQHILNRLPSSAHGHVVQYKLSDAGITNLGHMSEYGFYHTRIAPLEVFYNENPMRLARWPNEEFVNVVSLVDGQHGRRFTYMGNRPNNWDQENDMWAHGYWYWSWSDQSIKIQNISTSSRTITLSKSPRYGLRIGHYNATYTVGYKDQGGYFRVINVLAELDQPGEYYVDRASGILYIWPPTANGRIRNQDSIYVSLINDCIHLGTNAANLVFKGITIEACRRYGLMSGSSTNITLQEMEVKNTGFTGVNFYGDCRYISIQRCYFHDSDGGISISGGERTTLTPSYNDISDNVIWRFSRVTGVGANALSVSGVGSHVHHNHMYIGQYTAIRWSGNDHVIEFNHVHHTCMNASDCGAIHAGRQWTARGNVIRKNHIHHTLRFYPGADVRGIMLDDQYSSATIDSNVFYDNEVHVNIGGGRDNVIRNNIFYNSTKYPMQVDHRGEHHENDQDLYKNLHAVPYKTGIWASRYPKLSVIDSNHPEQPIGNQIYHNVIYDNQLHLIYGLINNPNWFNVTQNGRAPDPSSFYSVETADFRPRCFLLDFARYAQFPNPVQLKDVGPRYPAGPLHSRAQNLNKYVGPASPGPCTTHAPATSTPQSPYLPDGSSPNTLFNVSNQGCWLQIEKCPLHPDHVSKSLIRDTVGEQLHQAGISEAACLGRVTYYVQYCGSNSSFSVIYGPTGAMTLGGDGCFFAEFGCPKHNIVSSGRIIRDSWAEQHAHAAESESKCLQRAHAQYIYCGADINHPITSIYRPTGHSVTAGGGCWIKIPQCPNHPELGKTFYDSWGATNAATGTSSQSCLARAEYFWNYCGSHTEYPVTAYFRPGAESITYPRS